MIQKKKLNFIMPPATTYQNIGELFGIILSNHNIRNAYYNEFIQLQTSSLFLLRNGTHFMSLGIYNAHPYQRHDLFDIDGTNKPGLERDVVIDCIKEYIDHDYYVSVWGIDKYYIPNTMAYNNSHFYHGLLIFGYDDNQQTFDIASYSVNHQYEIFTVNYQSIVDGFMSEDIEYTGFLQGLKVKPELKIDFSLKQFQYWIEQYIYSQNTYIIDHYQTDPLIYNDQSVCGILTLEYIKLYLEFVIDKKISDLDQRILRMLYEHKWMLHEKIKFLAAKDAVFQQYVDWYSAAVLLAEKIKNLGLKFQITYDNKNLCKAYDYVSKIYEVEAEVINPLLDDIKSINKVSC